MVGFAVGIGGTLSTSAAGWLADHYGTRTACIALTGVGVAVTLVAALVMPETRPNREAEDQ